MIFCSNYSIGIFLKNNVSFSNSRNVLAKQLGTGVSNFAIPSILAPKVV